MLQLIALCGVLIAHHAVAFTPSRPSPSLRRHPSARSLRPTHAAARPSDRSLTMAAPPDAHTFGSSATAEEMKHPFLRNLNSIPEMWPLLTERFGDRTALKDPYHGGEGDGEGGRALTYRQLDEEIRSLGSGLATAGLLKGDKVTFIAENSHRWIITDQAIMLAGGISIPRGAAADLKELLFILGHSESSVIVAETPAVLDKLLHYVYVEAPALPDVDLTALKKRLKFAVVLYDDPSAKGGHLSLQGVATKYQKNLTVYGYDALVTHGSTYSSAFRPVALGPDDVATIMYTSGTTGRPKGAVLRQRNLLHQINTNTFSGQEIVDKDKDGLLGYNMNPFPGDRFLSILPTWHIFERAAEYWGLSRGTEMIYTTKLHFKTDLSKFSPHYLIAVPRLYETVVKGVEKKFQEGSPVKRGLVRLLRSVSRKYVKARRIVRNRNLFDFNPGFITRLKSRLAMVFLWPLYKVASVLLWKKIRDGLGGSMKVLISGGAALPMKVEDFFEMADVPLVVGYGLTETSPVITNRNVDDNTRGTAGTVVTGTQIRIADQETGEVLPAGRVGVIEAKGPQVMSGYYNNEEATDAVLTPDGWFNTGDLGMITPTGQLTLTGRAKDTIVLSNGENIEPEPIEVDIMNSPLVDQAMLVGQDERQLGGLLVPNLDAMWEEGIVTTEARDKYKKLVEESSDERALRKAADELQSIPEVDAALRRLLREKSQSRRPDEAVRMYRLILQPFSQENGCLTQTFKVKRHVVLSKFGDVIDSIYNPQKAGLIDRVRSTIDKQTDKIRDQADKVRDTISSKLPDLPEFKKPEFQKPQMPDWGPFKRGKEGKGGEVEQQEQEQQQQGQQQVLKGGEEGITVAPADRNHHEAHVEHHLGVGEEKRIKVTEVR
ncbi:unnamed protein product [Vitrella brassicaformis CCMP3155]|uniref:AMP-dependent synthetase/ligase domain-containing protein n=2 Tax=Vitrella brassicaformis TaxID=1169539 RepID=A0A0G4EEM4_VITBC|nr:unnamed protein product [Vitrella brassicaformis CCMP3155]|eukprot:CEL94456.1 unnamed protein product [Vitrella brassicaformis CCMP3155]